MLRYKIRRSVVTLTVAVLLFALPNNSLASDGRSAPQGCSIDMRKMSAQGTPEVVRIVELTLAESRAHVEQRKRTDSLFRRVQERAAQQLAALGYQPTDKVFVGFIYVRRPVRPVGWFEALWRRLVPTLYAEQLDGHEVMATSWDDGDNSTWEGNLYARNLSTGEYYSGNDQKYLPVPPEPYVVNWANDTDTNLPGPSRRCPRPGSVCGLCSDPGAANCALRQSLSYVWTWAGCGASAGICVATGGAWPACVGLSCWGSIATNWLYFTKEHMSNCYIDQAHAEQCNPGEE